jgi:hypothetical protein
MENDVDVFDSAYDGIAIAYVPNDELYLTSEMFGTATFWTVDLWMETIQYANTVTCFDEEITEM